MKTVHTPTFYMANLGAEMKRALRFYEKGMITEYAGARDRSKAIVSQFLSVAQSEGGKEEALLLCELVTHMDEGRQAMTQEYLDRYFEPFSLKLLSSNK
jgi:hypothetical protein